MNPDCTRIMSALAKFSSIFIDVDSVELPGKVNERFRKLKSRTPYTNEVSTQMGRAKGEAAITHILIKSVSDIQLTRTVEMSDIDFCMYKIFCKFKSILNDLNKIEGHLGKAKLIPELRTQGKSILSMEKTIFNHLPEGIEDVLLLDKFYDELFVQDEE